MNPNHSSKPHTRKPNASKFNTDRDRPTRWLVRTIALLTTPLYSLITASGSYAVVPDLGIIIKISGISSLNVRRGSQHGPAQVGTALQSRLDTLIVPGSGESKAHLSFYNRFGQDLGLDAETTTRDGLQTLYYFPCGLRIDRAIVEWANQKRRGCDRGLRVQRGVSSRSDLPPETQPPLAQLKSLWQAQASGPPFQYYCVVADEKGRSWLKTEVTRNPCQAPMEQCLAQNPKGTCDIIAQDRWLTRESDLMATVTCANKQSLELKADGTKIGKQAEQLWQQAISQKLAFCSLSIVASTDALIIPTVKEQVRVQVSDADSALNIKILEGSVTIVTMGQPEGQKLSKGKEMTYAGPNSPPEVKSFDANAANQTPAVQEFIQTAQPAPVNEGSTQSQSIVATLANNQYLFCEKPEPASATSLLAGVGMCFRFRKTSNRVVGYYFVPHSDAASICIEGDAKENTILGEALELSWPGSTVIQVHQGNEFKLWDGEAGHMKIAQGRIVASSESPRGRSDWIQYRRASLDIGGFYRYSDEQNRQWEEWVKIPDRCASRLP